MRFRSIHFSSNINSAMAFQDYNSARYKSEFREIFSNRYVTSLSLGTLLATIFHLMVGFIFFLLFVASIAFYPLWLLHFFSGLDPFHIINADDPPDLGDLVIGPFFILFFAVGGARYWGAVKQRLISRLYVLAGRPLASVVGKPDFNFAESSCYGIRVEERYFDFEKDCWPTKIDLEKLEAAGGEMRVWYVPSTGILVWAEWRPSV
jgi:hypothetical protein